MNETEVLHCVAATITSACGWIDVREMLLLCFLFCGLAAQSGLSSCCGEPLQLLLHVLTGENFTTSSTQWSTMLLDHMVN